MVWFCTFVIVKKDGSSNFFLMMIFAVVFGDYGIYSAMSSSLYKLWNITYFSFLSFPRDASRACAGDGLGWASLAFPIGDAKARNPLKSQSLGKHKLTVSDSVKPSRAKVRKGAADSSNVHDSSIGAPVAQPFVTIPNDFRIPNDFSIDHDVTSTTIPGVGILELNGTSSFDIDGELCTAVTESSDMAPHEYIPGLISGLDDYVVFPEFTDGG